MLWVIRKITIMMTKLFIQKSHYISYRTKHQIPKLKCKISTSQNKTKLLPYTKSYDFRNECKISANNLECVQLNAL